MCPSGPDGDVPKRSEDQLAALTEQIATVADADVVICATETGRLVRRLRSVARDRRIVAVTSNASTHDALRDEGFEVVRLPARVQDRYRQARLATALAFREGKVGEGDVAVCAVGHRTSLGGGDLVLVTDIEEASTALVVSDLVRLTDGIRPKILSSVLAVAGRIGRVVRRGKPTGALFVIGDSDRVLEGTRQLVMNPFRGHDRDERMITSNGAGDTLVELAKLDGAFVIRGDGLIRTAGTYLNWGERDVQVPPGLGARHAAAAAVSADTDAIAVVVSATDGDVRVFADGQLVMQMDPEQVGPELTLL